MIQIKVNGNSKIPNVANTRCSYNSITDGSQTINFGSEGMEKRGPVPDGWSAYWGTPPNVEEASPYILWNKGFNGTKTWTLSKPATIFGFELQGDYYGATNFTVEFYSDSTLVGSITKTVTTSMDTSGGAVLFAAQTESTPFNKIIFSSDVPDRTDYAVAQIRYAIVSAAPTVVEVTGP